VEESNRDDNAGMSNDKQCVKKHCRRKSKGFEATITGFRVRRPLRELSECFARWESFDVRSMKRSVKRQDLLLVLFFNRVSKKYMIC
jgi:hypothetical protein